MKAVLEFTLPEEREEHETALNGPKYRAVLSDLSQFLRSKLKYETLTQEQAAAYEDVRRELSHLLDEEGLYL
jgi:hypothetical protein